MRKAVLVVEDNEEEQKIFSDYLRFVGGEILTASDGEEALRLVEANPPDLILLDLRLPGMDGWEVLRRLRTNPNTGHIPVLAITAMHLSPRRMEEAGFCGYLEKPLAPYRVLEEIERCLGSFQEGGMDSRTEVPAGSYGSGSLWPVMRGGRRVRETKWGERRSSRSA